MIFIFLSIVFFIIFFQTKAYAYVTCVTVGCYSHNACSCNQQCTCNTDARTCAAQRATSAARVFAWTRNPLTVSSHYITADDINQLRSFLQQEQNARSTPSPADNNATTYTHPGSCTVQTTTWTDTVNVGSSILATTFNQLVTLLNTLKARANTQGASVTAANAVAVSVGDFITATNSNTLRNILIQSYQQCICASKVVCSCHTRCPCNAQTSCSCNAGHCSCYATCSCNSYSCSCQWY